MAWVAAVLVGFFEQFHQRTSAGEHPRNHGLQEAVAAFRGLFVMVGIIRIEIAHEDFSEGLRGQATAWRTRLSGQHFCSVLTA